MPIRIQCDQCSRTVECPRDQIELGMDVKVEFAELPSVIIIPYPDGWLVNMTNKGALFVCSHDCAADMSKKAGIPFKINKL